MIGTLLEIVSIHTPNKPEDGHRKSVALPLFIFPHPETHFGPLFFQIFIPGVCLSQYHPNTQRKSPHTESPKPCRERAAKNIRTYIYPPLDYSLHILDPADLASAGTRSDDVSSAAYTPSSQQPLWSPRVHHRASCRPLEWSILPACFYSSAAAPRHIFVCIYCRCMVAARGVFHQKISHIYLWCLISPSTRRF